MRKLTSILCAAMFFACGSTPNSDQFSGVEIGNPRSLTVKVVTLSSSNTAASQKVFQASLTKNTITKAFVSIKDIRLTSLSTCNQNQESQDVRWKGPYVSDLITGSSAPSFETIELIQESYCSLSYRIDPLDEKNRPSEIASDHPIVNHSLYFEGRLSSGKTYRVQIKEEIEFKLRNSQGFSLPTKSNTLFIALDLQGVLDGLDFSDAQEEDSAIVIDEDHNEELYERVKDQLKGNGKLFEDRDRDGELDSDEEDSLTEDSH